MMIYFILCSVLFVIMTVCTWYYGTDIDIKEILNLLFLSFFPIINILMFIGVVIYIINLDITLIKGRNK